MIAFTNMSGEILVNAVINNFYQLFIFSARLVEGRIRKESKDQDCLAEESSTGITEKIQENWNFKEAWEKRKNGSDD